MKKASKDHQIVLEILQSCIKFFADGVLPHQRQHIEDAGNRLLSFVKTFEQEKISAQQKKDLFDEERERMKGARAWESNSQ